MSPGALCILRAMDGGLGTTGWGRRLVVMAHVGGGGHGGQGVPRGVPAPWEAVRMGRAVGALP